MKDLKNLHIMIDFETLGTKPDSPVLSFGAVIFDKEGIKDTYYAIIEPDLNNKKVSLATLRWWMLQNKAAQDEAFQETIRLTEETFTDTFYEWLSDKVDFETLCIWSNGADFDIPILKNIMDDAYPFEFYNHRCFRTFKVLFYDVEIADETCAHNALSDALWQARYMIEILKDL